MLRRDADIVNVYLQNWGHPMDVQLDQLGTSAELKRGFSQTEACSRTEVSSQIETSSRTEDVAELEHAAESKLLAELRQ